MYKKENERMANKFIGMGRITAPLELKQTPQGVSVLAFTIAINRNYKQDGEIKADFINCVAWRQTAEFISKYFDKGRMIYVEGSMQTRSWDATDGTKRYATECIVESVEFTGEAKKDGIQNAEDLNTAGFMPIPNDDDLPF